MRLTTIHNARVTRNELHRHFQLHGKEIKLCSGLTDTVDIFKKKGTNQYYVISTNYMLEYAGLDVIEETAHGLQIVGDCFCQNIDELGGRAFLDLLPINQAKTLAQYIDV